MGYETAPYEELCGCVAVTLTTKEDQDCELFGEEYTKHLVESILKVGKRDRIVMADCECCHGSGLMPIQA